MIKLPSMRLKELSFLKISRFFLALFLICFPFQIKSLVYGGPVYITGNFNPYTVFFVYLTDIFLLLAFMAWGCAYLRGEQRGPFSIGNRPAALMLVLFLLLIAGGTFFADDKLLAFLMVCRFALLFLFYIMIVNGVLTPEKVIKYFLAGMLFQCGLAVLQYLLQRSLGLGVLGESDISALIPGVAKIDWNGAKLLRAYGTFPHANILGGAIFMALIFSLYRYREKPWLMLIFMGVFAMGLILTFSRSAFFALAAAFLLYIAINEGRRAIKYVILAFSLLLFFIVAFNLEGIFFQRFLFSGEDEAMLARSQYLEISRNMLTQHPLGVGLGQFTNHMQLYITDKLQPWLFQPVHNVFLLITNEIGLPGGLLFMVLTGYLFFMLVRSATRKKNADTDKQFGFVLLALLGGIVTIELFDHYFFTIYQGQVMLFLYLGLASLYLKKFALPRKKS